MEKIIDFIHSLNPEYVGIAIAVVIVAILVLIMILTNHLMKSEEIKRQYLNAVSSSKKKIEDGMRASKIKAFNHDELEKYISKSGLGYMTSYKMTPMMYMMLRMFFALFMCIIGMQVNVIAGLVLLPIGYFGLDFIINESDKSDNAHMLDDIKNVYDTLRIQTKAGVYITSVITDCYLVVQNKRLKDAFLKLTSDIIAKKDMDEALENFRNKFNNEYIDALVIIIKQSMKTGQAVKMFEDIRNQITDIELAMMTHEKIRIQTKITIVQIMLYTAIIGVAVFMTMTSLMNGINF